MAASASLLPHEGRSDVKRPFPLFDPRGGHLKAQICQMGKAFGTELSRPVMNSLPLNPLLQPKPTGGHVFVRDIHVPVFNKILFEYGIPLLPTLPVAVGARASYQ
jgi:hypothetical protein